MFPTSRTTEHNIAIIIQCIAHFLRTPTHSNIVRVIFNIIIAHHHNNNKNTVMILVCRGGGCGDGGIATALLLIPPYYDFNCL